jgi:hypothetical protein
MGRILLRLQKGWARDTPRLQKSAASGVRTAENRAGKRRQVQKMTQKMTRKVTQKKRRQRRRENPDQHRRSSRGDGSIDRDDLLGDAGFGRIRRKPCLGQAAVESPGGRVLRWRFSMQPDLVMEFLSGIGRRTLTKSSARQADAFRVAAAPNCRLSG